MGIHINLYTLLMLKLVMKMFNLHMEKGQNVHRQEFLLASRMERDCKILEMHVGPKSKHIEKVYVAGFLSLRDSDTRRKLIHC